MKYTSSILSVLVIHFALILFLQSSESHAQSLQTYNWNNVQINGGGFVTGVVFNKSEKDLFYARTDVGGSYRWDKTNEKWIALMDNISDWKQWGNVSLATDPIDPNRVYVAAGIYSWELPSYIFSSVDKGNTWTKNSIPIALGGNDPGRGGGERLQVDPNDNSILLLGSNYNGLWKSTDFGITWNSVASFPSDSITFVLFDKSSSTVGDSTKDIYIGVSDSIRQNRLMPRIYKSSDAGATWSHISGQPTQLNPNSHHSVSLPCVPLRAAISGNDMYFTYSNSLSPNGDYRLNGSNNQSLVGGAVYKYNKVTGVWNNITPQPNDNGGYGGISVNPTDPNFIIVSTLERYYPVDGLWYSMNGGVSWNALPMVLGYTKASWANIRSPHWIGDVEIDPFNNNRAIMTTGYGVFITNNLSNAGGTNKTIWRFENDGLEETVALGLISPPSGQLLISALADIDGFKHDDLSQSPSSGTHSPNRGSCQSIDFAGNKPSIIARTYSGGGAYSTDGATSWKQFSSIPGNGNGYLAVSAGGENIVWSTSTGSVYYSKDLGVSWTASTGVSNVLPVADKVNTNKFYALVNGVIYYSNDAGATFSLYNASLTGLPSGTSRQIVSVLGHEGHLWAAMGSKGLYYTTNGGATFTSVGSQVEIANNVSLGKAKADTLYPSVFIDGQISGKKGLFRSDDVGIHWVKINDDNHQWGNTHRVICADPRVFGRLYIGTEGRGILYGDTGTVTGVTKASQIKAPAVEEKVININVFPNPSENNFTLDIINYAGGDVEMRLMNAYGQTINTYTFHSDKFTIDNELSKGVYFLKVKYGDFLKAVKIVKE